MAIKIGSIKFKGGVASSSTISTIAGILSEEKGKRVLIVDLDPQNTQRTLLGVNKGLERELSMAGILTANYDPRQCLTKITEKIHLIHSGGKAIEAFNRKNSSTLEASLKLKKALEEIEESYDYILTDLSPTMSLLHQSSIIFNDYLIIPCDMDILSLTATRSTVHLIENVEGTLKKEGIEAAKILGVIPLKYNSRRVVDTQILEDLYSLEDNNLLHGGKVFNTIRESANMKTAQARRKLITEVYPKSKLTEDYRKLVDNIIREIDERGSEKITLRASANKIPEATVQQ